MNGEPIATGYPYVLDVTVTSATGAAVFPEGCRLAAQFRQSGYRPDVLATATTENGGLARLDDNTVRISLSGEDTQDMDGSVLTDLVRTDLSPDRWIGVQLRIPVEAAFTQTGGDA